MKPNDKAIEAGVKLCWDCPRATPSMIRDILTAAYAAQFQSEDYAVLIEELRLFGEGKAINEAADALEVLLAERDTYKNWLDNYEKKFAAKVEELVTVRLERDALLARLAPVEDEALVEIAARAEYERDGHFEWATEKPVFRNFYVSRARAVIAAIRPHIEAAERERCAKIAEHLNGWGNDFGKGGHAMHIAAAIRSGK